MSVCRLHPRILSIECLHQKFYCILTVHKSSATTRSATPVIKWFSTAIAEATENSADIPFAPFPKRLRDAVEPHMRKCRDKRASMLNAIRLASGQEQYDQTMNEFGRCDVSHESMFRFDRDKHRLREHFVRACGLPYMHTGGRRQNV